MAFDLPPIEVDGRLDRVRFEFAARDCDAMVVSSRSNVRWCTGFSGSFGQLLVTGDAAVLLTDSRYGERACGELFAVGSDAEVVVTDDVLAEGTTLLTDVRRVAFEADHLTWAEADDWSGSIDGEALATSLIVAEIRSVKDEAELARMQQAATIVDDVLADSRELLEPGTTESELALALDDGIRARGARGPAYETIVAGGPNSALPHASPSGRPFEEGDLVVVDVGAEVDGYRSDMTRTFAVGRPSAQAREIVAIVTEAQEAGVAAVKAGIQAAAVDDVCRGIISEAGFGEHFSHGTGHGVGLDIHELPAVRRANTAILQPGHVITIEPGIYLPGIGGVRIEDSVVVTESGCRPLTHSPKLSL